MFAPSHRNVAHANGIPQVVRDPGFQRGEPYDALLIVVAASTRREVVGAGTFTGCRSTASTIGAGPSAARWFCPGFGIVQDGFGAGTSFTAWSAADHTRWLRGTLEER